MAEIITHIRVKTCQRQASQSTGRTIYQGMPLCEQTFCYCFCHAVQVDHSDTQFKRYNRLKDCSLLVNYTVFSS
jgi:coproporphyrinogen III oxidase-like Fe-S oxidoreductase